MLNTDYSTIINQPITKPTLELRIHLRDLLAQNINKLTITNIKLKDKQKEYLCNKFQNIRLDPYNEFDKILKLLRQKNLANIFLNNNVLKENIAPIILFQNLPIDRDLIDTPSDDSICANKGIISELSLLLLTTALGANPYINKEEKSNSIIQNIIPIQGKENELSGAGSLKTFDWHTENIHEENPADYFILLALRGDKNAFTSFMLVKDIVKNLPKSMIKALLTTNFIMKTGPSYLKEQQLIKPILSLDANGDYNIYYNSNAGRCIPLDKEGKELYEALKLHLKDKVPSYHISLKHGEAVILNNKKALHKRDAFNISTTFEERRWLQVIYLKRFM